MRSREDLLKEIGGLRESCREFNADAGRYRDALDTLVDMLRKIEVNLLTRLALDRLCEQAKQRIKKQ